MAVPFSFSVLAALEILAAQPSNELLRGVPNTLLLLLLLQLMLVRWSDCRDRVVIDDAVSGGRQLAPSLEQVRVLVAAARALHDDAAAVAVGTAR